jgi:biopolymer transport protein TolR
MSTGGGDGGSFGSGPMLSEINITPLVDVMLVLLIIFMVTTPLLQQGVEVALPKASAPGMKGADTTLIVTVRKDQKIFMAKEEVDLKALGDKLQAVVANNPDKQVFLKADKEVPYGAVVQVMATVRKAGVTKLGMVTQPGEGEAAP